ncbi:Aste57867_12645 [Aphanomyces stellatus]|uniref:Aste57867_12645 protein n=1 Tax=Aphanomyces stellatus TaxID=120398 RepID=A0A485KXG9_9STRA|nr:hypothetical protein As57867_012599 [Aphanomyces stellatus]VFT89495.1 Aste57867_12645 [Aphanomyces stellatus]
MSSQGKMKMRMTLTDKHALCTESASRPTATYNELAAWAFQTFNLATTPTKATIGNILKRHRDLPTRADSKARSIDRPVKLHEVETKLVEWVLRCEELGVCITGELIRQQAKSYCQELGVPSSRSIAFSKGWLFKFQQKHGLSCKTQHGEAASVAPEAVRQGRKAMLNATGGYSARNIYNMDETAFFYCMSPHRSITRNRVPGSKKSKKRITVALTTNSDGSDHVEPLFIGTAARPRCFRGRSGDDMGFDYHASKKGWMTGAIFSAYLSSLNKRMIDEGRKVLLLVDNAPSHTVDDEVRLENVKVQMLPKNTTAHLQPQDAGVIASFKAKLKQRKLKNALDQIDMVMRGRQDRLYEVPLDEAMAWAKEAWRSVSQTTVSNCWARTGIVDGDLSAFGAQVAELGFE